MTVRNRLISLFLFPLLLALAGCSTTSVMPRKEASVQSAWTSFEEAKGAYEKIVPHQTTIADLKALGFDPYKTANIQILSYLDVMSRFMPNEAVGLQALDQELRDCIEARSRCYALEATPSHVVDQRSGNLVLDMLQFKEKTVTSGWRFKALIVLHDDQVVYKLWGGTPKLSEVTTSSQPLGPLNDVSLNRFL